MKTFDEVEEAQRKLIAAGDALGKEGSQDIEEIAAIEAAVSVLTWVLDFASQSPGGSASAFQRLLTRCETTVSHQTRYGRPGRRRR